MEGVKVNTYYHSIRESTTNLQDLDPTKLVTMDNELAYSTIKPTTREQLVVMVKGLALHSGFRAIIPFADRNNKNLHSTCFTCCMGGVSGVRKVSSSCPFKVTYVKKLLETPFYVMSTAPTESFLRHNHPLPIEEYQQ